MPASTAPRRTSEEVQRATWDRVFALAQRCGVGDVLHKMPTEGIVAMVEKYVDELETKLAEAGANLAKAEAEVIAAEKQVDAILRSLARLKQGPDDVEDELKSTRLSDSESEDNQSWRLPHCR